MAYFFCFAFAGCRDKHFLCSRIEMCCCFVWISESSCTFYHYIDFEFFPRKFNRFFFCKHLDFLVAYLKMPIAITYLFWKNAMHRIVFEKMSQSFIISKIVDSDNIYFLVVPGSTEHHSANPTKTINGNINHVHTSFYDGKLRRVKTPPFRAQFLIPKTARSNTPT